jgi:RimJ/RimL family protein N-acetyltransferase
MLKIRRVCKDDCYDLWVWRNHPKVRNHSFINKKIPFKDHKDWFNQRIKDKNTKLYIAENENGEKIGQIRFEINKKGEGYINVNLNPVFFNMKIGNIMISEATDYFLKENKEVDRVIAEILEDNIASVKAFEKAGFSLDSRIKKDNKKVNVYIYEKK